MIKPPLGPYEFRVALRLMDAQRRVLQDAKADPELLRAFEAILRYLHRLPPAQLERLLGHPRSASKTREQRESEAHQVADIALSDVEKILKRETTTRSELEAIAVGRFSVPRGSLRSIGNAEQLKELIVSFVNNEKTHQSISEVARDQGLRR